MCEKLRTRSGSWALLSATLIFQAAFVVVSVTVALRASAKWKCGVVDCPGTHVRGQRVVGIASTNQSTGFRRHRSKIAPHTWHGC